ncbi:LytR C-terminal domain-containing protein [Nocardioides stalactiti]|uniref:LytR C-terminal domain-containing protein n=1 Tax=Nocardioides stalactiti TaxID=2755356 RepID=UPI0016018932|nr:LytR C-terminal domain-containing protein [Nocardioides stalactiti]
MTGHPSPTDRTQRNERGAVLPSPVVWLSIVAVAVAAFAFVATRGAEPEEREIQTSSSSPDETTPTQTPQDDDEVTSPTDEPTETETSEPLEPKKTKPPVERADYGVVVFNNTSIAGLAGEVLTQVQEIGWNAVAADNWYGTIPATTVYFPPGKRDAAQKLALDLGIQRIVAADPAMSDTNLTVILTGDLA